MKRRKVKQLLALCTAITLFFTSSGIFAAPAVKASDEKVIIDQTLEEKVNETLSTMTLRDRSYFSNGAVDRSADKGQNPNVGSQTKAFPKKGLSYMSMSDGPMGVNQGGRPHTSFGSGMIISSTWNPKLTKQVGDVVSKECIAKDVQYFLGPATNINRDLANGRTFEYYSEDPYMSSQVITPYVQGVQENNVLATVKHYLGNNQERNRNFCSSNMSERALHEVYLPAFKDSVENGDAWGMMTAANRTNGIFTSDNRYTLTNMLKYDYGFRGIVMTDWCNVRTDLICAKAGLDIGMPESNGSLFAQAKMEEYVRSGKLDGKYLDNLAQRVVRTGYLTKSMITTDEIDNTGYTKADRPAGEINTPANQAVSRAVSEEGIVLLKNEKKVLPLDKETVKSIAVLGKYTDFNFYANGGGSGTTFPPYQITNIQGLNHKLAGLDVKLNRPVYNEGNGEQTIADAVKAAQESEVAVIYAGLNSTSVNDPNVADTEDGDRPNLNFPAFQQRLIQEVSKVNPNTIVVLSGSIFEVRDWIDQVPAVIQTYYPGMEGGNVIADILFGDVNPSGKLTNTWPKRYSETQGYVPGHEGTDQRELKHDDVWYKEGVYVGYKWYDKLGIEPEFAFGHGLSYTDFEYSNVKVNSSEMDPDGSVIVSVDVTNTGDVAGKEVVQMYINDPESTVSRPVKELKGFEKVSLKPGETKTVSFKITADSLSYWDVDTHSFKAEKGEYQAWIGGSSDKLPMKVSFNLTDDTKPDADYTVIQAEDAEDTKGTESQVNKEVDAEMTEAPDTEFIKFKEAGSSASWKINVKEAGEYSIIARFSNDSFNGPAANSYGENKVSKLTVNGKDAGDYDFQNTRYENVWNYDSLDVALEEGENTITITAGEKAADLNIDKMIVQKLHKYAPDPAPCAPDDGDVTPPEPTEDGDVYQAETGKDFNNATIRSYYHGYTGEGYVGFEGAGSSATWDVLAPTFANGYRVALTYANGTNKPAPCEIFVNGVSYGTYYLAPTGGWNRWKTEQSPILAFRTGLNTIRVVSKDNKVNIDQVIVSGGMADMETKAPVVNGSVPMNGKILDNVAGPVEVAFSEVIVGTENLEKVTLETKEGKIVPVSVKTKGSRIQITPEKPLDYNNEYVVTVPKKAVRDERNNLCEEEYQLAFKTTQINSVDEREEIICYTGNWEQKEYADAYKKTVTGSNQAGNTAAFWLDGPNAVLFGVKGPDQGIAEIKMDDGETVTVDLYSEKEEITEIYRTASLSFEPHYVTVTVTGNKNENASDCFVTLDKVDVVGNLAGEAGAKTEWRARSFAQSAGIDGAPEGAGAAIDGNKGSRWVSCEMQRPGQWYILDLGKEREINTLMLYTPNGDYTRGYEVYVSNNADAYENPDSEIWGEPVSTGNGKQGYTTVRLGNQSARYIKIIQTGKSDTNWWCLYECNVLNTKITDKEAPSAPEYLQTKGYNGQIVLTWDPASDDVQVTGYHVYRDGKLVGTTTKTTFTDVDVLGGKNYTYEIEAFDATGKKSDKSEAVKGMADPELKEFPKEGWVATAFAMPGNAEGTKDTPLGAIDGNPGSRWTSSFPQNGDGTHWFQLDLGLSMKFDTVNIFTAGGDWTRGYQMFVSDDGINWGTPVAEGDGVPENTVISFETPQVGRYIKFILTKGDPVSWWSINELSVFMNGEMETVKVEKDDLRSLIGYAESQMKNTDYANVIPVVKAAFEKALAEAVAVNENEIATQEEVDTAYEKLLDMVHMLDFIKGDTKDLQTLVDVVKGMNKDLFTEDSWAAVEDALAKAEVVLADENAMQEEIDAARDALKAAKDALVRIPVDKTKLQKLVDKSKKYEDTIKAYTPGTADIFKAALANAREVLSNEDVTQKMIDEAYVMLQNAVFGLRFIPNKDKLEDLIGKARTVDVAEYTAESAAAFETALNYAEAVFADADATEEQVKAAEKALKKAQKNLVAKADAEKAAKTGDANTALPAAVTGIAALAVLLGLKKRR